MIYTIGYQQLAPQSLRAIVTGLGAVLVDVRSVPKSRVAGFGGKTLEREYGERYLWAGDKLGGRAPGVTTEGIALLADLNRKRWPALLLCMEELPHNCHRHHKITLPYFPKARHIFYGGWAYSVADVQAQCEAYPMEYPIDPIADPRLYAITAPDASA